MSWNRATYHFPWTRICDPPARNESPCYLFTFGVPPFSQGGALPCIDFGFWMESVSPVFSTSEKYTCFKHTHTHTQFIHVISMCLKQATLQIRAIYMMKTWFGDFSKWHILGLATLHCHNFKTQNSRKYPCDSFREVGSHYKSWKATDDPDICGH